MSKVGQAIGGLDEIIEDARRRFAALLEESLARGPTTLEQYVRYLSMQYHLTKGVQRYFITAAAHSDLARRKKLRTFLFNFANEEELHYLIAANDLRKLGRDPLPEPFDVSLWHAYFQRVVVDRPFIRLGAACILENISAVRHTGRCSERYPHHSSTRTTPSSWCCTSTNCCRTGTKSWRHLKARIWSQATSQTFSTVRARGLSYTCGLPTGRSIPRDSHHSQTWALSAGWRWVSGLRSRPSKCPTLKRPLLTQR